MADVKRDQQKIKELLRKRHDLQREMRRIEAELDAIQPAHLLRAEAVKALHGRVKRQGDLVAPLDVEWDAAS